MLAITSGGCVSAAEALVRYDRLFRYTIGRALRLDAPVNTDVCFFNAIAIPIIFTGFASHALEFVAFLVGMLATVNQGFRRSLCDRIPYGRPSFLVLLRNRTPLGAPNV